MTRLALALVLALTPAVCVQAIAADTDVVLSRVSFVGCPGDGQQGPVESPVHEDVAMRATAAITRQLSYYRGKYGPGVLAPKGWHCRLWYGSDGAVVTVMPVAPAARVPPKPVEGPGLQLILSNGDTSGRFAVAAISARFFPVVMHDFIERVRAEDTADPANFEVKPYAADTITGITERMIEFSTAGGQQGFGTVSFEQSDSPVRGLVALSLPPDTPNVFVLRVRLSDQQEALATDILKIEAACLRRGRPC